MRYKKMRIILLLLTAAGLLACGCYTYYRHKNSWKQEITAGKKPVTNPMKGFAAWGENYRDDPWISFAYVPVYWNLLEPEEGVYDFEELETRCEFLKWKENNVRLIFRVVADSPSDEMHMDIPEWLYKKMDGAGDWYDGSYGKGFSPDYRNRAFQEAHKRLINALSQRYGDDPYLAFVQLGSLGHWGEWHVDTASGIEKFPFQAVTDQYVQDYLECFSATKLLLRRPYEIGKKEGLGLYNDSFGDENSHELWLSWISDGYVSDQNQEQLSGMPDFWKNAPSGGEFAASHEKSWYFSGEQFSETMELMKKSHTTFLGPNAPEYGEYDKNTEKNVEKFLQEMGYCLGIRECRMMRGFPDRTLSVEMMWENTGIAPLYGDWDIYMEIRDETGIPVWKNSFESRSSSWIPGEHPFTADLIGTEKLPSGKYTLWTGIADPLTGEPGVALQMETGQDNYLYKVLEFS